MANCLLRSAALHSRTWRPVKSAHLGLSKLPSAAKCVAQRGSPVLLESGPARAVASARSFSRIPRINGFLSVGLGGVERIRHGPLNAAALSQLSRRFLSSNSGGGRGGIGGGGGGGGLSERNRTFLIYLSSVALGVLGLSYAAVPLYQVFCQQTGYGGTTQKETNEEVLSKLQPVQDARPISIYFHTYTGSSMPWEFVPEQKEVVVVPGETALAFFEAHNPSEEDIIGVATYNVLPARAGVYFHKIQCFCFDEQRLKPHERVDMPVFFYVDPKILTDPQMKNVKSITLSYTFFRSASGDEDVADAIQQAAAATAQKNTAVAVVG